MKIRLALLSVAVMVALSGCGDTKDDTAQKKPENSGHEGHTDHVPSGDVPEGLKTADDPTFKVGSQATIQDGHMPGMKGAKANIAGAYSTTAYVLSYTPTTGGERVQHHKWVIHEEIENAGQDAFKKGQEVTLLADHMKGMKGAKAVIESAEQTTVYTVDYTPTTGGETVRNHKWVTESELSAP
ncbi:YdhK family protein [Tumebacillus sp. DT12]|uniref:YdhK family protein n=1 Tax=Tumebacillus lacus TaxID=2995335 RepID=A0ABT3X5Z9_9BACL|nr:YdhK family protein [Tumebacillus lacus]MCX7571856.1 YdhK family protein [Tumebacillus lacus]